MNLQKAPFQPDPHVSFLDVIFCLCVFLVCLLSIMMTLKDKQKENVNQKEEKTKEKNTTEKDDSYTNSKNKLMSTRFKGRGGQPIMDIKVSYYEDTGLIFNIAGHDFSWIEFRKIICNFDRREQNGQPALIFRIQYDVSYQNASPKQLSEKFGNLVSVDEISKMKERNISYIINLYKESNFKIEKKCREFKKKYTTEYLGNWDGEKIGSRSFTDYSERKTLGDPFLWFTVDNKDKKIILGPIDSPVRISPSCFVDLVASIRGRDGFYIEYRSNKTLKYNKEAEIPDWVIDEVISPLNFSKMIADTKK